MDRALTLVVPDDLDGERADKVISTLLEVSRSRARELIEAGARLEGRPVSPGQRLRAGDVMQTPAPAPPEELLPEPVTFEVVHEDPDLIVVSKPAGVVVHPGAGATRGTLAGGLLHRYPELAEVGPPGRSGLVHRLDRDTSGLLLVARNPAAHQALTAALAERRVGRTYLALAHGRLGTPTGTIDAPLARDPAHPTRRAVVPGGKPARTHYLVVEEFPDHDLSLLEVTLETGRTHQIRAHFAAIGHPLAGDRAYSRSAIPDGLTRVFLHARTLELDHPGTGKRLRFQAPLPPDLAAVLDRLRRPRVT